jgi:hypothetical protein
VSRKRRREGVCALEACSLIPKVTRAALSPDSPELIPFLILNFLFCYLLGLNRNKRNYFLPPAVNLMVFT